MMITLLALLALILTVGDWLQTRYIANHPAEWHELNPLLGEHPTPARVNAWFGCFILIFIGGIYALNVIFPTPWAAYWFIALSILEGFMVVRNSYLGIKFYG